VATMMPKVLAKLLIMSIGFLAPSQATLTKTSQAPRRLQRKA